MKWVFDEECIKGVKIKSLPKYSENVNIMRFEQFNKNN